MPHSLPKYSRWKITQEEEKILLYTWYYESHFPTKTTISSIAVLLGKTDKQIKVWFQNKRQRNLFKKTNLTNAILQLHNNL